MPKRKVPGVLSYLFKIVWVNVDTSGEPLVSLFSRSHDNVWHDRVSNLGVPVFKNTGSKHNLRCSAVLSSHQQSHIHHGSSYQPTWHPLGYWDRVVSSEEKMHRSLYSAFCSGNKCCDTGFLLKLLTGDGNLESFGTTGRLVSWFEILTPGVSNCHFLFSWELYT